MPVKCREQDADTVEFFLMSTPFPRVLTDDYLRQAATDLADILRAPKHIFLHLHMGHLGLMHISI